MNAEDLALVNANSSAASASHLKHLVKSIRYLSNNDKAVSVKRYVSSFSISSKCRNNPLVFSAYHAHHILYIVTCGVERNILFYAKLFYLFNPCFGVKEYTTGLSWLFLAIVA